jgi:hypothetical protein
MVGGIYLLSCDVEFIKEKVIYCKIIDNLRSWGK